jgi:ankyrin repeat protein
MVAGRDGREPPRQLDLLLVAAASFGHAARLRWLLDHGADPDATSIYDGKSAHHTALLAGQPALAALLLARGATPRALPPRDAFLAACARNDRTEATRLLAGHPEFLEPIDPLNQAAERGDHAACALLLEVGMNPNLIGKHDKRPLHVAWKHPEIVDLLLKHGADPRARVYGGTLSGWARHGADFVLARRYAERSRLLLDAVASGHVALATELLAGDPSCSAERSPSGDGALHALPEDAALAEALIELLLRHGADPDAPNEAGQTAAQTLVGRGLDPIADLLDAAVEASASSA